MELIVNKTKTNKRPESLDLKIPENVNYLLIEQLNKVLNSKKNKAAAKLFFDAVKDLKPKNSIIKTGFVSGEYIVFNCKFEKNGDGEIITEIVNGMENKERDLFFMMGLDPKKFLFFPDFFINATDYFFFCFKLLKK